MIKILFFLLVVSCSNQETNHKTENIENKIEPTKVVPSIKNCVCAELWLPVCGENGKTYSNACFAQCAGVKYHQGTCKEIIKD